MVRKKFDQYFDDLNLASWMVMTGDVEIANGKTPTGGYIEGSYVGIYKDLQYKEYQWDTSTSP